MKFTPLAFAIALVLSSLACRADDQPKPASKPEEPALDREALEKAFAEKLTGATLVGSYTIDGQDLANLKTDRYELKRVDKIQDDTWHFHARIKYGDIDSVLPIPLTILWAGDTPMISMTNTMVPGMGTFTVRLMFHGDRYAGTWQHDETGGLMFGKIEKAKPAEDTK